MAPETFEPCNAAVDSDSRFSIIWITDTQYLSESHPAYFNTLCNWIVKNTKTYNLQMVIHTGDIVNNPENLTEWASANDSMSLLLANRIPYCWDGGNHDQIGTSPN